jgi:putative membrane protein
MSESTNGHEEKHVLRGILAGAGAGLAASWVMNLFMTGPGQKLTESLKTDEEKIQENIDRLTQQQQDRTGEPKEDATMKAADAIVSTTTGGRHLSFEARQKAGPVVHYAFGAVMGGLYGGLAEYSKTVQTGFGTAFGGALFAGADLAAVPAFQLSPPLSQTKARSLANPLAAHLVYGAATELLRRAFRAVL